MCISAGASVSGGSWKTISIPSMRCVSIGSFTLRGRGLGVPVAPGATRGRVAQARVDLAGRPLGKGGPELELSRADHRRARQDVLGDDLRHEPIGRPDLDPARAHVALVDDAADTAVVVDVAVRVD